MKKKYIIPECMFFMLHVRSMLCLSKGNDEEHGVAESKKFWGNSFWEEDYSQEEDLGQKSF